MHGSPAERRASERRSVETPVGIYNEADGIYQQAMTVDLCDRGAKVRGDIRLTPGEFIDLILKATPTQAVSSKVVWAKRADGQNAGEAGLEFMEPTRHAIAALSGREG